jgi:hypothetical protein
VSEKSGAHFPGRECGFLLMSCERLEQVIRGSLGRLLPRGAACRWEPGPDSSLKGLSYGIGIRSEASAGSGPAGGPGPLASTAPSMQQAC